MRVVEAERGVWRAGVEAVGRDSWRWGVLDIGRCGLCCGLVV